MRTISLLLFIFTGIAAYPQPNTRYGRRSVNIYNIEKWPASCACNLEHLFDNWNAENTGLKNAGDLTFVSYTYIGTIRDTAHIEEYLQRTFAPDYPVLNSDRARGILRFRTTAERMEEDMKRNRRQFEENEEVYRDVMGATPFFLLLRPGDMIFSVKFRYKDRDEPYDVFVFCAPEKNQIVLDLNFKINSKLAFIGREPYIPSENEGMTGGKNIRIESNSTTKPYFNPNPSPFSDPF